MKEKISKVSLLQLVLTLAFVVAFLTSNIITGKHIQLPFGLVMTGGLFVFPLVYSLSDIFSEVYGYKWSRITCYLAFAANLFMVFIFTITLACPSPDYWVKGEAYATVLGSTWRILAASMIAFIIGDFVNDKIFKKLKANHQDNHKGFKFRAFVSSICGEFVDGLVFMPLAFLGSMPMTVMLITIATRALIKVGYELILLPFTEIAVKKISAHENKLKEVV